jgi:hypothetical protein
MCGGSESSLEAAVIATLLVERPLAVKPRDSIRPVLAGLRIAFQCWKRRAIDGLHGYLAAHAVKLGIHAVHLLDAPADQRRRAHHSQR